jgi:hypothetical protein
MFCVVHFGVSFGGPEKALRLFPLYFSLLLNEMTYHSLA